MSDRGMIKWRPFNSVVSGKEVLNNILKEKAKVKMPEKSDEELKVIEEKIINAFYMEEDILINYFKDGFIYKYTGKIKKIDQVYKMIYLENKRILFKQIIDINY